MIVRIVNPPLKGCTLSKLGTRSTAGVMGGIMGAFRKVPSLSSLLPPLCDGSQGRIHTFIALKPHPHPTNPLRSKSDKLGTRHATGPSQEFPQEKIPTPEGLQLRKYATSWRGEGKAS